jgi:hypothetical protein
MDHTESAGNPPALLIYTVTYLHSNNLRRDIPLKRSDISGFCNFVISFFTAKRNDTEDKLMIKNKLEEGEKKFF